MLNTPQQTARRIMEMVGILHGLGYQNLYLCAYLYPIAWRFNIGAFTDAEEWPQPSKKDTASDSVCNEDQDLDWCSYRDDVDTMAEKFVDRYPVIARKGRVDNLQYASWYADMLRRTAPNGVLAFASENRTGWEAAFTIFGTAAEFEMPKGFSEMNLANFHGFAKPPNF